MYSFTDLEQSIFPCPVLTVASCPAYRFFKRQFRWSGIPFSLRIFQSLLWSSVTSFGHNQWSRSRCSSGTLLFFYSPTDFVNLISGSSAFSKSSLNTWKFLVHVLLNPCLEDFEHYFASMWNECNCVVNVLWHCPSLGLEWKMVLRNFVSHIIHIFLQILCGFLSWLRLWEHKKIRWFYSPPVISFCF